MLNISNNPVQINVETWKSFQLNDISKVHTQFRNWLLGFSAIGFILLFFPWTQNITANGEVIALAPADRPQNIEAIIPGKIDKWYINEGQFVRKGDTLLKLSEIKPEYFDTQLLERTQIQVNAKKNSVDVYTSKGTELEKQANAFAAELRFKIEQLNNKMEQMKAKIESDKNDLEAANLDVITEEKQLLRTEDMFKEGLKSLSEVENKRLKLRQTIAKQVSAENKLLQSKQEQRNLEFQVSGAENEYAGKIAKAQSDKYSTLSDKLDAVSSVQKLENQLANYTFRSQFYWVLAPQDCYISKVAKVGIGETVKEGEEIISIVPANLNLGVEVFIKPIDLPLAHIGAPVRLIFDGYPSIFFSGWPEAATGAFYGKIFALDNVTNEKGKYRVLVAPDSVQQTWPTALRPGSGAQSFTLLKNVPVWYELWRQLNGFPPEFYTQEDAEKSEKKQKLKVKIKK